MKTERVMTMKESKLSLPVCLACLTVQYPIREVCVDCLSCELEWQNVDNTGEVLATTVQRYTLDEKFNLQLPLYVASIKLASGPVVITFADPDLKAGQKVSVVNRKTATGEESLFAVVAN